jgi:hypothetical protein
MDPLERTEGKGGKYWINFLARKRVQRAYTGQISSLEIQEWEYGLFDPHWFVFECRTSRIAPLSVNLISFLRRKNNPEGSRAERLEARKREKKLTETVAQRARLKPSRRSKEAWNLSNMGRVTPFCWTSLIVVAQYQPKT